MKKATILIMLIINLLNIHAQIQPPNADFENWMTLTNGVENPEDWGSSNFAVSFGVPQTIFKTTDAISGDYALLITTPSDTTTIYPGQAELNEGAFDDGGLPYTYRPLMMEAWIKGTIFPPDTAFLRARLTRWNVTTSTTEIIGEAYIELTSINATYSLQIDSFEYISNAQPDTLFLVAGFGDHDTEVVNSDNQFFVDNIVFTGLSTNTLEFSELKTFNVFPNPTNSLIQLNIEFKNAQDLLLTICNNVGQVIYQFREERILELGKTLDLSTYPEGVYFLNLKTKEQSISERVVLLK